MPRLEIEVGKPEQFAEVLYYNWTKAVRAVKPNTILPDWTSLPEIGIVSKSLWMITARNVLTSYMAPQPIR